MFILIYKKDLQKGLCPNQVQIFYFFAGDNFVYPWYGEKELEMFKAIKPQRLVKGNILGKRTNTKKAGSKITDFLKMVIKFYEKNFF